VPLSPFFISYKNSLSRGTIAAAPIASDEGQVAA
jgi:hypothetical protein